MRAIACLVLVAACQRHTTAADDRARAPASAAPSAEITAAYKQDIANLCDVVHLSGADQLPEGDRNPTIAMWLGPHITTEPGHQFLVAIQPLVGMPKAAALDTEAKRVGLDGCALADLWRR